MVSADGMFTFYETITIALWFTVVGYKFLTFGYFLLLRYRKSKRIYWLYFSLFFIFLAASRVGYMLQDYFTSPNDEINKLIAWRWANIMAWVAVASLSGILSTLLFTSDRRSHVIIKRIFPIIPLAIGIHILFIPNDWIVNPAGFLGAGIAKLYMNVIFLPIFVFLMPFMFFYLAKRSAGTLQRSFLLNGIGLLLYYSIRVVQAFITTIWSPLLILLAILLIVFANQYEHLK